MKRLFPYSRPYANVLIGLMLSMANGCVWPTFGAAMIKCQFTMMKPDLEQMKDETWRWCLWMLIISFVSLICVFTVRFSFGVVGENITEAIRNKMYTSVLKKSIGWFDLKENAAGVLTTVLANDASSLQGASTEALGIIIESMVGLLCGAIIAFFFSWQVSLVAIGSFPIMTFGGWAQA